MQIPSLRFPQLPFIHSHQYGPNTSPKVVDLYPLYPVSVRPAFMTELRTWYIATYKDRFFTEQQPAWFWLLTIMEAGIHVPISFTSIAPLWKGQGMLSFSLCHSRLCTLEFSCVYRDWSVVPMYFAASVMECFFPQFKPSSQSFHLNILGSIAFKFLLLPHFLAVSLMTSMTIPPMRFMRYFTPI